MAELREENLASMDDLACLREMQDSVSEEMAEEIMKSWQRCREYGVPKILDYPLHELTDREMENLLRKRSELIEISLPIINTITKFMEGSRFIVALADACGVLLTISGDEKTKRAVAEGGFKPGVDWSEKSAGSNAVGTGLAIGRPIQLNGMQHYCALAQRTAGTCAVIRDTSDQVIGAVILTGRLRDVNHHTLGMTIAMAAAIENMIRISREHEKVMISEAYKDAIMESISQGVIALDRNGVMTHINHAAAALLQIGEEMVGKSLEEAFPYDRGHLGRILRKGENVLDQEVQVRIRDSEVRLLLTQRNLVDKDGRMIGVVLVLDEPKRVRRLVSRYSGASARLSFDDLIGKNERFVESVEMARAAARSQASILLLGDSGTGKDVFAQSIHNASRRRNGPFVAINCGAIPRELVASTLFGYVDGAFTGARKGGSIGQFEMADGGTIFLDEIGEMPLDIQVHLLRVLENRAVTRVGDTTPIPVDVRVIAATNADLRQAVVRGYFREDLYYRLNVISLHLPPLRERREDIPLLARHIYHQLNPAGGELPREYVEKLKNYSWPGNIRELRNIIERTWSLSYNGRLDPSYIPEDRAQDPDRHEEIRRTVRMADVERETLLSLLDKYHGNITQAARELGMARSTVYRKMKKYGLAIRE